MTRKRSKRPRESTRSKRKRPRVMRASRHPIHATKKSPAQLDREITEALSRRSSRHSTLAKGFASVPGLTVE